MSDNFPPELVDRQRAVSSAIIEKILNDPTFRQQLIEAPEGTLRAAGFLEEFAAVSSDMQSDVSGYSYEIEGDAVPPEYSQSCYCCVTGLY